LAYIYNDCSLLEINPLIITKDKEILPLDCKMQLDDNALYRHAQLREMRDKTEEPESEVKASELGLNYIDLDGNIGCMVNGAGLAMATMDIIKLHGAEPANFLDVGGGANKEQVTQAFHLIVQDPKVKAILVNIFGGIMKCDVIAQGIIEAAKELKLKIPLTVRLKGTNVEIGKKLLAESGLAIQTADNMTEAAQKVIASIQ
jgi:succinyl-CoA synthetase beta subunit